MNPHRQLFFYLCLVIFGQVGCRKASDTAGLLKDSGSSTPAPQIKLQNTAATERQQYPELELFDEMTDEAKDSAPLEYNGFHVRRKTKKVLLEETTKPTELSYAQILRKGNVLLTFDGVEHSLGNETRFGLFPFLSPDSKQLLVQQDAWRSLRQWVVSLEAQPKILMDSRDYLLEGFSAMDLDQDGQFELVGSQKYWHFEFMKGLSFSSADSPVVTIIFAYNPKRQEYEPANPRFKTYLLEEIAKTKNHLESKQGYDPKSLFDDMQDLMTVLITLSLVGEEKAAWELFDRYCPVASLTEKEDAKYNIKLAIRENTIYKFLRKRHLI